MKEITILNHSGKKYFRAVCSKMEGNEPVALLIIKQESSDIEKFNTAYFM